MEERGRGEGVLEGTQRAYKAESQRRVKSSAYQPEPGGRTPQDNVRRPMLQPEDLQRGVRVRVRVRVSCNLKTCNEGQARQRGTLSPDAHHMSLARCRSSARAMVAPSATLTRMTSATVIPTTTPMLSLSSERDSRGALRENMST